MQLGHKLQKLKPLLLNVGFEICLIELQGLMENILGVVSCSSQGFKLKLNMASSKFASSSLVFTSL